LRALEVYLSSGITLTAWQRQTERHPFPFKVLELVLAPEDRSVLHERIVNRFDQMLQQGFLDEMRGLLKNTRLHPDLPSMRAVGYRQAWAHLRGETHALEFREQAIIATRQLAKRQLTWFRSIRTSRWFDPQLQKDALDYCLQRFIGRIEI
jgi:tRNA dimethylallyltransferase